MPPQQLGALSPLGWFVVGVSGSAAGSDTDPISEAPAALQVSALFGSSSLVLTQAVNVFHISR